MSIEQKLISGFTEEESRRIGIHLNKLIPYLDINRFVIVGGLAIRYHLTKAGMVYPQRPFNDLDIIAEDINVVSPKVKKDFLIYHHHPQNENGNFYLVLVDPVSKTKIDIFDYSVKPQDIDKVQFGSYSLNIQSPEDQLVKTVADVQRLSVETKVDPKQFSDAHLLVQIADIGKADEYWRQRQLAGLPDSIVAALERAEQIAQNHPIWLKEKPFRKEKSYICQDCVSTADFPITPMEEIYKLLGYVE